MKLAVSDPVPEIVTPLSPRALPQAELVAETGLFPGFDQDTMTCGPVAAPAIAPSATLHVQPLGFGVQPVAVAVNV